MPDLEERLRSEFRTLRQRLEVSTPAPARIFKRQRTGRWLHRPLGVLLGTGLVVGGSAGIAIALTISHTNTAPIAATTTTGVPTTTTMPPMTTTTAPAPLAAAPNCDPQLGGSGFEPSLIFIGCATSADNLGDVQWSSWTATNATGTAMHNINDCQPDCAAGTFSSSPVEVTLSAPATLNGVYVFTTIAMTPTTSSGSPETATNGACAAGAAGPCSSSGADWGFVPNSP